IVATLRRLEGDETLLIQSGKPVGVFTTSPDAPRVLIANAMLVPAWGDWEHFRRYEAMGLTMYAQMTAGSWIYIGTQGVVHGNAAEVHPELASRGVRFDVVTDQTSAHDMLNGYIPAGLSVEAAAELRARDPEAYLARAYASLAEHMRAMLELQKRGAILFDYGNNVRREAENAGVTDFAYPGFVPAFIRSLFCCAQGRF